MRRSRSAFPTLAFKSIALAALFGSCLTGTAEAKSASSSFYDGKDMTLIVYSSAGGTYDAYARLLARHMPRHIPGKPHFVVKNMVGAGGVIAARYLYVTAPKDGLTIGTIGRGLPFEPMLGGKALGFDPLKFTWLGSMDKESSVAISWHTASVKTAQDLLKTELLTGSTSAKSDNYLIPKALNGLIGTKFKLVTGYHAMGNLTLALERGEVLGIGYWGWGAIKTEKPDWISQKKVNLLFQTGMTPRPGIPDVPLVISLARNDEEREALELLLARDVMARPFVAPPGIPPARTIILRTAFTASLKDQNLLEDADKHGMEISPASAEEIQRLLDRVGRMPKNVIARTRKAMGR